MTWADFYLICFLVGFLLSLVSILAGATDLHLPHFHIHADVGHVDAVGHGDGGDLPFLNFGTIAAFLAWFGGSGYLLVRFSSLWSFFALGIAFVVGLIGAGIIFLFLIKTVMRNEVEPEPEDPEMVGVLGKLSIPIRQGGTGETVFTQGGTRHCSAAKSEDGKAIPKGAEVVVTRFEKGIAYVRRWEELAGETATDVEKQ
jgi:membrane protein implicated in regulation of membrane protease activity